MLVHELALDKCKQFNQEICQGVTILIWVHMHQTPDIQTQQEASLLVRQPCVSRKACKLAQAKIMIRRMALCLCNVHAAYTDNSTEEAPWTRGLGKMQFP